MVWCTQKTDRSDSDLNRKALCTKLLSRLDRARAPEEESHYQTLIGLLFAGQE